MLECERAVANETAHRAWWPTGVMRDARAGRLENTQRSQEIGEGGPFQKGGRDDR